MKRLLLALPLLAASPPTASQEAFANPQLLVRTDALEALAKDAGTRIVDVRPASDYGKGHIPGAVNVPTDETFAPKGPRMMLGPAERIAKVFGEAGIDLETRVVVYDEGRSTTGARVFWTLEVFGHRKVAYLDGGFAKWKAEKRPVTKDVPEVAPKTFRAATPSSALSTLDHLLEDVENEEVVMLDVRSEREWDRGRIPGAVRIEWTENFTDDDAPVFKSPKELYRLYASQGVTKDKRVHAY